MVMVPVVLFGQILKVPVNVGVPAGFVIIVILGLAYTGFDQPGHARNSRNLTS